ncbi:MAG: DUF4783 domain-containing protein [Chitinophagaceae bacterium]|nr:DUF4783 domain-containing protein [Chitinophagaceae bacterium]
MRACLIKILIPVFLLGGLALNYSLPRGAYSYSPDDIITSISAGNAGQLSKHFDRIVDITLHEKSNSYSSSQAEVILKDFFHSCGVESFSVVQTKSDNDREFYRGDLNTGAGRFNTVFSLKLRGKEKVLQEIRFEEP